MPELTSSYRFGEFLIQPLNNSISKDGESQQITPRMMDMLIYLITHHERVVSHTELLDHVWAGRVVEESAIHRHISQVRIALGDSARNPTYIKTISKRGYQAIATVAEVSKPEQIEQPAPAEIETEIGSPVTAAHTTAQTAIQPQSAKKKWLTTSVLSGLVAVALLMAATSYNDWASPWIAVEAVAVLPFDSMNAETEVIAQGLTDAVLFEMSKNTDSNIASGTETAQLANQSLGLNELAKQLAVYYVVEGSVQQMGSELRVTAQLIRTSDGFHVWSKTYTHQVTEGFEMQDAVSANVANSVMNRIFLDSERQFPDFFDKFDGVDRAALSFYLDAMGVNVSVAAGEPGDRLHAMQLIQKALDIDPDFAEAHLEQAWNYAWRIDPSIPLVQAREQAHTAFNNFNRLRPNDPGALFFQAQAHVILDLDYAAAQAAIEEGMQHDPKGLYWTLLLAYVAAREGRFEDAVQQMKANANRELVVEAPDFLSRFAQVMRQDGEYDQALQATEQGLKLIDAGPVRGQLLLTKARTLFDMGQVEKARSIAEQAWSALKSDVPEALIYLFVQLGDTARAQTILDTTKRSDAVSGYTAKRSHRVSGYIALGDTTSALDLIREGIEDYDISVLNFIRIEKDWDPIRDEPQFVELLAKLRTQETHTVAFEKTLN